MGHHELGRLSGSRKWRQVIALISGGADGARKSTGGSFMFLCMATHLKKPRPNPPVERPVRGFSDCKEGGSFGALRSLGLVGVV
jgi:hypothetical protein